MVEIGSRNLSLINFSDIVFKGDQITLNPAALEKVDASFLFLKAFFNRKTYLRYQHGFRSDGAV